MKILLITEQRDAKWNKTSFETLAAAQQIAKDTGGTLSGVVIGNGVAALADDLAGKISVKSSGRTRTARAYTPDGYSLALAQVIQQSKPDLVLLPHTYQVRDFAPKLAASFNKGMIGDCMVVAMKTDGWCLCDKCFRAKPPLMFRSRGPGQSLQRFRPEPFAATTSHPSSGKAPVKRSASNCRRPKFAPNRSKCSAKRSRLWIDTSADHRRDRPRNQGSGKIARRKNSQSSSARNGGLPPICDEGWLPMERQIGSSGQTVAPKLYSRWNQLRHLTRCRDERLAHNRRHQ